MCVSFETNLFISRRGDVQHNMKRVANSILPFLDPDIVLNRPCRLHVFRYSVRVPVPVPWTSEGRGWRRAGLEI